MKGSKRKDDLGDEGQQLKSEEQVTQTIHMDTCKIKHAENAQISAPQQVSNLLKSDHLEQRADIEAGAEEVDPVELPIATESFENPSDFEIIQNDQVQKAP